jgi:hypothetical protein
MAEAVVNDGREPYRYPFTPTGPTGDHDPHWLEEHDEH